MKKEFINASEIQKITGSVETNRRWSYYQIKRHNFKMGVDVIREQVPVPGNKAGKGLYVFYFSKQACELILQSVRHTRKRRGLSLDTYPLNRDTLKSQLFG